LIRRAALPVSRRSRILPEVSLYTLADDLPELRDAVMVASFDGWVDAAEAASGAVAHVAGDSRMLATFDPDALFDYRSRRPILDVNDGRLSNLSWPDLTIRHARAGERDLLVFSGAEPDLRWRELAGDVAELAGRLGYRSEAAFSRAFKRVLGIAPGAARNRANAVPA
jgi:AraC-like DNA-binding protein